MTGFTHHGGRLDQAMACYPDAPLPWIDLSTGINPVPWQPSGPLAIDWGALPSLAALRELEARAAAYFGAPAETVAAVPGSDLALRLLPQLGLPGPYRYGTPGYRTHAEALPGAIPVSIPVPIDDAASGAGTLLLANPNNPDGRLLSPAALDRLRGDGWLVVDEAFADCLPEASIVPALPDRTIVLRSFGKFFGLAGLRLGFVIGPPEIVARVRALLGDWPVSSAAIALGTAAYRDAGWIAATRIALIDQAAALDGVLQRHGLVARGACPLFRLVAGEPSLFERLARAGILARPFDYAPTWLRFGLPADAAALARLDRALAGG
ncbi:aminotransferase class I/II-fold pyridoxal phosphate-dependent enzyme [Sphingomonas sp. PB4P5]|uniref:aminotransferase class I/II-fold pyridoxal phosphate-dependent enzyme n=1 Tax=Parasphingomonas puruogangriensis TaxID=3096155 RepID=UPI002FC7D7FD